MADNFWMNGSDQLIVDGSEQPIDCPDCPCDDTASTPCNPTPVPRELPLTVTYLCNQVSRTIQYDPTVFAGQPGWTYGLSDTYSGPVDMCGVFDFADFSLRCVDGVWVAAWAYLESGLLFGNDTATGSMTDVVIVNTSPLCVTTTDGPYEFSGCGGTGFVYFAIGDCDVVPPCCVTSHNTATLSWSYGGASGTLNLVRVGDTLSKSTTCQIGATDFTVIRDFFLTCTGACIWSYRFRTRLFNTSTGIVTSFIEWTGSKVAGEVSSDWSLSCSPLHFHLSGLNTNGSTSGGAGPTALCGDGNQYRFGTAGSFTATLDVVTP